MKTRPIIVNGLTYHIGSWHLKSAPCHYKGFGGNKYTIRYHDGELLKTDDLILGYKMPIDPSHDTAVILPGWNVTKDSPVCGWQPAGEYRVFGPVR